MTQDPFGDVPEYVKNAPPPLEPGEHLVTCRFCPWWFVSLSEPVAGQALAHHARNTCPGPPRERIVIRER